MTSEEKEDLGSIRLPPPSRSFPLDKNVQEKRESTASDLANIIVWTFTGSIAATFIILACQLCYFFLFANNLQHDETITLHTEIFKQTFELFKTLSAVISGPIGFVLGFYFRESLSKEKT